MTVAPASPIFSAWPRSPAPKTSFWPRPRPEGGSSWRGSSPAFRVVPSLVDESSIREADPVAFAVAAAILKARDVGDRNPASIILAADTVVSLDGEIFGKPANRDEARATLRKLSGRRHRVITGVALYRKEEGRMPHGTRGKLRPLPAPRREDRRRLPGHGGPRRQGRKLRHPGGQRRLRGRARRRLRQRRRPPSPPRPGDARKIQGRRAGRSLIPHDGTPWPLPAPPQRRPQRTV